MKELKPEDVDIYIEGCDMKARPILNELREIIKSAVPGTEEGISWGVPFYRYHGALAGFAVYKKHVSFGGASDLEVKDREILEEKGYKTGIKTVQIRFDQKVPAAIITRIIKTQAEINVNK